MPSSLRAQQQAGNCQQIYLQRIYLGWNLQRHRTLAESCVAIPSKVAILAGWNSMGRLFAPGQKQGLSDNTNNPGLTQVATIKPDRRSRFQVYF